MLKVFEALQLVDEHFPKWELGMKEVFADRDYPPFHRVMMDGIALSYDHFQKGERSFRIEGICAAGEAQKSLVSGCLEVMTGAPLPNNADLVIPYEHLKIEGNIAHITFEASRTPFDFVHLAGSDCKKSDKVLEKNLFLNGPHAGIAASMGEKLVSFSPKVLIISTGNELVEANPLPHEIRRSNVYALKTSMELFGYQDITLSHLSDDPKLISDHYQKNAEAFDILIYSGGVSKGKFDYLPHVWADLGVTKYFHEVAQRPGKPLWFGVDHQRKTSVIGLPGNPVSSLVCLHRYFLPQKKMMAFLDKEIIFKKDLTLFAPVKVSFDGATLKAIPVEIKNSGEFSALAGTDGFIELSQGKDLFPKGEVVNFFPWRSF